MAFSPTRPPPLSRSLELCDLAHAFAALTTLIVLRLGPSKHIHTHTSGNPLENKKKPTDPSVKNVKFQWSFILIKEIQWVFLQDTTNILELFFVVVFYQSCTCWINLLLCWCGQTIHVYQFLLAPSHTFTHIWEKCTTPVHGSSVQNVLPSFLGLLTWGTRDHGSPTASCYFGLVAAWGFNLFGQSLSITEWLFSGLEGVFCCYWVWGEDHHAEPYSHWRRISNNNNKKINTLPAMEPLHGEERQEPQNPKNLKVKSKT